MKFNIQILLRFILFTAFWSICFFPAFFIPRQLQYKRLWPLFSKLFLWAAKLKIYNFTEIDLKEYDNVIYISNHKTFIDPFMIIAYINNGKPFTIVLRKELLKNPFMKYFANKMAFIAVNRDKIQSQLETLNEVKKFLKTNHSIIYFPEGRYFKEDKIGKFKRGIANISKETGNYIVPIAIHGIEVGIFNRKKAKWHDIYIKADKPIKYSDFKDEDKFLDFLRNKIENIYNELDNKKNNKN